LLEALELNGTHWATTATFDDGAALFQVMVDRGLEGIVAKRLRDPYLPGGRSWVKVKNRTTARFNEALLGARSGH
jgi:ATP-dependent DNA ligase